MHQRLGARGTRARRVGPVTAGAMITLVALPLLTGLLGAPAALASGAGDVTASQDNLRTGWDSHEPGLSPAALRDGAFGRLFVTRVSGQVYAQPLVAGAIVIVATENDWVYGLTAATGKVKWSDRLGTPWPAATSSCTDLAPTVGITSTPVYDPATRAVYLVAETIRTSAAEPAFRLFGIDARTGRITERVPIGGSPANAPQVSFDAFYQWQRTGLLLMGGRVYAAFGSHCDDTPYAGFVAGVNISTRAVRLWTDEAGEADGQAGIWQSGSGLMSDGRGRIFFASGNGVSPPPGKGSSPPGQLGESVVRLAVRPGGKLAARDFYSPRDAAALDASDGDLGSGGPVGLPFGTGEFPRLLVQAGKDGRILLLDRDNLGGRMQGRSGGNAYVSETGPFAGQWGHPAVFGGTPTVTARNSRSSDDYLYYVGKNDYLRVFRLRANGHGRPYLADVADSRVTFGFTSGSPLVTSDGTDPRSAVVWVVRAAGISGSAGRLEAFRAVPSATCTRPCALRPLWSAPIGTASKFAIPASSNGRVFLGTRDDRVLGFGVRAGRGAVPQATGGVPPLSSRTGNRLAALANWLWRQAGGIKARRADRPARTASGGRYRQAKEKRMPEASDWNSKIIAEFRANGGKVGGQFEGAPLLLLHTVGAKSGQERVNPVMYQTVGDGFAVFASKAGAPTNPDWYYNLVANPRVRAEIGTETLAATARVAEAEERDRIFAAQKDAFPGFGDYERQTTRQIPVVILEAVR